MWYNLLLVVHVLACVFLVLVVLLQTGKGADMGAVFGGSSSTVFGSSGAGNFLTRLTTATAIIFMLTSMGLTYLSNHPTSSTVFDSAPVAEPAPDSGAQPPPPAAPNPAGESGAAPAPADPGAK